MAIGIVALLVIGIGWWRAVLPALIALIYLLASGIAIAVYAIDKRAATHGQRRQPEKSLHLIGLFGGWPGALIAQKIFHHKTSKREFQAMFWCTVVANCLALYWLLAKTGMAEYSRMLFGY